MRNEGMEVCRTAARYAIIVHVPAKTYWENVAKNILAFITAVTNRKHLGISLAETAQDLCGKIFNLVKSPKNR